LGQDSLWEKKVFNEILTLNIAAKSKYTKSSFVKSFGGEAGANFYGFQYYDTILLPIETENQFQISLTGFVSGRASDPALKKYDGTVVDTLVGGTKGLMAHFTTNDTLETYKQICYYVTIANSQYYWFYVYSPSSKYNDEGINFFFRSIIFDSDRLKEKAHKLTKVNLKKKAD
jgi:hypothetical protein